MIFNSFVHYYVLIMLRTGSSVFLVPRLGVDICKFIENEFKPWYNINGLQSEGTIIATDNYKMLLYRARVMKDLDVTDTSLLTLCILVDSVKCFFTLCEEYCRVERNIPSRLLETLQTIGTMTIIDRLLRKKGSNRICKDLRRRMIMPHNVMNFHNHKVWMEIVVNYLTADQLRPIVDMYLHLVDDDKAVLIIYACLKKGCPIDAESLGILLARHHLRYSSFENFKEHVLNMLKDFDYPHFQEVVNIAQQ